MASAYTRDEVERLERELGVTYEEAEALLSRAGGDKRRAVRLYAQAHGVEVEAEKVESRGRDPMDAVCAAARMLWRKVFALRLRIARGGETLAAIPLIILFLAVLAAPKVAAGSLLVMLFLGFRFHMGHENRAKIVL